MVRFASFLGAIALMPAMADKDKTKIPEAASGGNGSSALRGGKTPASSNPWSNAGSNEEFEQIAGPNNKCVNSEVTDPLYQLLDQVANRNACEAKCLTQANSLCYGYSYSSFGEKCLLWQEWLHREETQEGKYYDGCWIKKEFEQIAGPKNKCLNSERNNPAYQISENVADRTACEAKCRTLGESQCYGYSYSSGSEKCLLWQEELHHKETQEGRGYDGCWIRKGPSTSTSSTTPSAPEAQPTLNLPSTKRP